MERTLWLVVSVLVACGGSAPTPPAAPEKECPACPEAEAQSESGLVTLKSNNDHATTVEKLKAAAEAKGLTVMAVVDHAANAKSVKVLMQPTTLLLIGKPAVGTKLMQASRTAAIDLPQKFLVWQHPEGTSISYNDPAFLAKRHELPLDHPVVLKVTTVLGALANSAAN